MQTFFKIFVCRHAAREAEPKDYDLSKDPVRDLKIATYKHIAAVTDVVKTITATTNKHIEQTHTIYVKLCFYKPATLVQLQQL